jgi:hypothetical protein
VTRAPFCARLRETTLVFLLALAATYPVFIETFRAMVFRTAPRDDYAPYLLRLVGRGGELPGTPQVLRFLSVAVAVPFYHLLPGYRFRYLRDDDPDYRQATEALAFVSWLALAATATFAFRTARDRCGTSRPAAAAALLATPLLAHYTSLDGVDALALLLIAAAGYWLERTAVFAAIVVVSVGFNEKVAIVATLLLVARTLAARTLAPYRSRLLACAAATVLYAGIAFALHASGKEKKADPRPLVVNAPITLGLSASAKGLTQNVFPVVLCLGLYAGTARVLRGRPSACWTSWDVLVPLGLCALGIALNVGLTLGRLVMHVLPLMTPPLAVALEHLDGARAETASTAGPPTPTAAR